VEEDGTPFGRYRLISLIGQGGMGEVWRAHDTGTDRIVAIKLLPAHFSKNEDFQRRFRREAHAAGRLDSPHVIPIHDYGEIDGRLYVCMRLIKGRDLQTVLADGPLESARAVRIIEHVALALHAAHKVGLLHRDVKPSNILLDDNDFAYLIDFGIARAADETRMTKSGNTIGTFQYIAPERLGTRDEDARADIYSLACVLYECLTGRPPFDEATMAQLVAAHLHTPPPRPSTTQPDVPAQIDPVIATGMAKDPDNRYATTVELADAARDAITVPIEKPAPRPAPPASTELAPSPAAAPRIPHERPPRSARSTFPSASTQHRPGPLPAYTAPARRNRTPWIIAGVAAVVVLIGAGIGIPALVKHGPSESSPPSSSSPTSSSPPTSSERSYGAQIVLPFTGLKYPGDVAVDRTGSLYVVDMGNSRVLELAAGSSTQEVLPFTGVRSPGGVAVDAAGDIYVTDTDTETRQGRVLKLAAGTTTQTVLPFIGLNNPGGVAVDAAGDVYVADTGNTRVLKLAAGSTAQTVLSFTGVDVFGGVAVDATGDLYVTDCMGSGRVVELAAGATTQTTLPFTGLIYPCHVAVDGAGGVYVGSGGANGRVLKLAAGSTTQTVLPFIGLGTVQGPIGVAVDAAGDIYVTDHDNARVLKLPAG
jgi:serine/threonine-protein kinase